MSPARSALLALVFTAIGSTPAAAALDQLAPADGASVSAGSPVTFRVKSEPSQFIVVNVSRSSAIADAKCGTIGDDLEIETLSATADPSVYEGSPQVFQSYDFWLNRPGSYYWQAHRHIGADVCETTPVRRLDVTGIRGVEIAPQPLLPEDGATLPTGPLGFQVSVAPVAPPNYLWIYVSRSPERTQEGNLIGLDAEIEELSPTADPTIWTATPKYIDGPSFWMNQAGTYYWQPFRISSFGDPDGFVEGAVRSFTLQAPPPPPEPVTIRGNEAFTKGTANDLYLACTPLDLYVIDVLPAPGGKVSVTGAADLRLRDQTAEILLDGRRVGSAVIGQDGAFAAKVRAPSKARRARARYQARVGATRSQNLRLERRMVAARLTSSGNRMTLTGRITKPFAKRLATIGIQRYSSCSRKDTIKVKAVRPTRSGSFKVTFARPAASVRALMFRATTRVARHPGGRASLLTFTLPRAINVG